MADTINLDQFRKIGGQYFLVIIVVIVLIVVYILNPFVRVDRGERVVIFNTLTGVVRSLPPGTHIVIPLVYSETVYITTTQKLTVKTEASTEDIQTIDILVSLNYSVNPEVVDLLHKEIGPDYNKIILQPAIQQSIKSATSRFQIENIIKQRPLLKKYIEENMNLNTKKNLVAKLYLKGKTPKMITLDTYNEKGKVSGKETVKFNPENLEHVKNLKIVNYFIIENVFIEDVKFSKEYAEEVERKKRQEVRNMTAKEYEIETRYKKAAQRNLDDAEAYRQKILSATASQESIQLKWIDKWDGKLPVTVMGGNTKALINLPGK